MSKLRVLGPRQSCIITGLVKNSSEARFGIGKKKKREMRAVIHRYVSSSSTDDKYSSEDSIYGWIEYLKNVDRQSYHQMNSYLNRVIQKSVSS